jgi:hypothetical protein
MAATTLEGVGTAVPQQGWVRPSVVESAGLPVILD